MCRVLQVTPSGFRSWRRRLLSTRKVEDGHLKLLIENIYDENKGRYGAPRIQAELAAQGRRHSVRRIARLMRALGLYGKTRRKFVKTTDSKHAFGLAPKVGRFRVETRLRSRVQHRLSLPAQGTV